MSDMKDYEYMADAHEASVLVLELTKKLSNTISEHKISRLSTLFTSMFLHTCKVKDDMRRLEEKASNDHNQLMQLVLLSREKKE